MVFCASNFCVETLYLWMTIQDSLLHYYHYNLFIRLTDSCLYTLQTYSWCRYLLFFHSDKTSVHSGRVCTCISALILLIGLFNYGFFVDDKFLFISKYGIVLEMLNSTLLSMILIYTAFSRRNAVHIRYFKQFNLFITGMLILIQWWTSITMVIETYLGLPFEAHEYMTGSLQQMLIILAFAIYVYKTDYSGRTLKEEILSRLNKSGSSGSDQAYKTFENTVSVEDKVVEGNDAAAENDLLPDNDIGSDNKPSVEAVPDIYISEAKPSAEADSGKEPITEIAVEDTSTAMNKATQTDSAAESNKYMSEDGKAAADDVMTMTIEELFNIKHLTNREREVAMLAYSGMTNPEIAEKLFISEHTVKRHMHSIFEKLEISARIELVHLMNGK
ncbi:MAG: helix-turn-helix transcriptional regulator [Eubacteriales bacterium]|nr:helix-turn-helix transcriptional regulator [Eubacteriales bacterium]